MKDTSETFDHHVEPMGKKYRSTRPTNEHAPVSVGGAGSGADQQIDKWLNVQTVHGMVAVHISADDVIRIRIRSNQDVDEDVQIARIHVAIGVEITRPVAAE